MRFPYLLVGTIVLFCALGGFGTYLYVSHFQNHKESLDLKPIANSEAIINKNSELINRLENMIETKESSIVNNLVKNGSSSSKLDSNRSNTISTKLESKTYTTNEKRHYSDNNSSLKQESYTSQTQKSDAKDSTKASSDLLIYDIDEIEHYGVVELESQNSKNIESAFFKKREFSNLFSTPKLAIIIDDIALNKQLSRLLELNLKITPSILPPTSTHQNSHKLSYRVNNFLVHLPLEAYNHLYPQEETIKVGDTYESIDKKIAQIRELFPHAKYINNHTGSKFTSNEESMKMLLDILKKYNFTFLDSRTSPNSLATTLDKTILYRDVFLDNIKNEEYIHSQLKLAVDRAKKRGFAIAIGHPSTKTLSTIDKNRDLFRDVELVYIDELYEIIYNTKGDT